jgi:hypothetical protein
MQSGARVGNVNTLLKDHHLVLNRMYVMKQYTTLYMYITFTAHHELKEVPCQLREME